MPSRSAHPSLVNKKQKKTKKNNNNNNHIQRCNSRYIAISSLRHKPSPTRTLKWPRRNRLQIMCNTSSVYHVQHVLRATLYKGTAQLLSLTELKSHLFKLDVIGWTIKPLSAFPCPQPLSLSAFPCPQPLSLSLCLPLPTTPFTLSLPSLAHNPFHSLPSLAHNPFHSLSAFPCPQPLSLSAFPCPQPLSLSVLSKETMCKRVKKIYWWGGPSRPWKCQIMEETHLCVQGMGLARLWQCRADFPHTPAKEICFITQTKKQKMMGMDNNLFLFTTASEGEKAKYRSTKPHGVITKNSMCGRLYYIFGSYFLCRLTVWLQFRHCRHLCKVSHLPAILPFWFFSFDWRFLFAVSLFLRITVAVGRNMDQLNMSH